MCTCVVTVLHGGNFLTSAEVISGNVLRNYAMSALQRIYRAGEHNTPCRNKILSATVANNVCLTAVVIFVCLFFSYGGVDGR